MKKIIFSALIVFLVFSSVGAQTADNYEVFITWRANNFFPSDYQGKAWATPFSQIEAAVTLVKNKKIADLANAEIFWYLDRELIGRGLNLQTIDFQISKQAGDKHFLSVNIKPIEGGSHNTAIEIPILEPQLVVANNFLTKEIPANSRLEMTVTPYFFNIRTLNDLLVKWQVKNQTAEGLQLAVNAGAPIIATDKTFFIEINASNRKNLFETISKRLKMTIY